jgi:hypothetical protein
MININKKTAQISAETIKVVFFIELKFNILLDFNCSFVLPSDKIVLLTKSNLTIKDQFITNVNN